MEERNTRPSRGILELRTAIAELLSRECGASIDRETNVLVTNGAMHALDVVFRALLGPGDRVIIPSPTFFYGGMIRLTGAEPVYIPCYEEDGWRWDLSRISQAIDSNTKLFIACNPSNPTGYLPTRQDIDAILELAQKHNFVILSDESYERLVYDGASHYSIGPFLRSWQNTVLIRSMSKSYAMSTWRIGYIVGSDAMIDACLKVFEWECLYCNYIAQKAAAAAIQGPQDWLLDIVPEYQRNRDIAYGYVQQTELLSCICPKASPFLFINVSCLGSDCRSLAEDLLLEAGIPTVAGWYFQAPGYVRVPFGGDIDTIHFMGESLLRWADNKKVRS
jgi:aminotransferase